MRTAFELIDSASKSDPHLRVALYMLGGQIIANQAVTVALARGWTFDDNASAKRLIEEAAGYPGVTARHISDGGNRLVSDYTFEAFMSLARKIPALKVPPL